MEILQTILTDGFTPTIALVGVCMVCWYLWKQYYKYIRFTMSDFSKNHDLIKEVQNLVKDSEQTNKTINDEVSALRKNISNLEKRLSDLEKLDIKANADLSSILKEIEAVRRTMENYQLLFTIDNKIKK